MKTSEIILASVLASLAGVVFAEGEAAVTDTAMVSDTFGIVKFAKSAIGGKSEIVVSTPWVASDGKAVTVDKLVTNGLAENDELSVYDPVTGSYKVFRWTGSAWEGATDTTTGSAPVASETSVAAGMGVWYKPASKEGVFSVTGAVSEPVTTATASGKKTLIVDPFRREVDLVTLLKDQTIAANKDALVVGTDHFYHDGSSWYKLVSGGTETVEAGGKQITITKPDVKTTVTTIPVGVGEPFWFDSKSGTPAFVWRTAPNPIPQD